MPFLLQHFLLLLLLPNQVPVELYKIIREGGREREGKGEGGRETDRQTDRQHRQIDN